MEKSLGNLNQLINNNYTVEIPTLINNIPQSFDGIIVLEDLLIEVGYEIQSIWEDRRIHTENEGSLLEARIVNPQGETSLFLDITMQELVRNAQQNVPFFKKANPLIGLDAGEYSITIQATSMCVFWECLPNPLLFSIIPIVKMYVDGSSQPLINVKDSLDCNLVGHVTTGGELSKGWTASYKKG
ncbi:hypothetical protein [Bacillus thuringiensis]|uniref:hypothetical protein n=1 Tax=Bacillus thuringiensis TaxID=1428 RepID=UPI000B442F35|nr:hypothetical protein [Bacillus thuringiensis]MED3182868.1 hypothetical protein [Bacillus thuringiensis]OTY06057.1 hypothetical protein BK734_21390 [Bacillus thuringiensis serovar kim]OUB13754.1 hypothetical protein BK733_26750 [Bacillus thuringiensis serovar xiaguangiensis]PGV02330.1 hypothetical protein COD69_02575 [Bacillus thuringiensis]